MSQLSQTTNELIVDSLRLIGELGVQETADAYMLTTGLSLINEVLNKGSSDSIYVPYLSTLDFDMVPNQAEYSISDIIPADITQNRIIDLAFATYTITVDTDQPITYPLQILTKSEYYGVVRLANLFTRPNFIFLNKQPLQSLVTLYPAPDQPYPCSLKAKVMLDNVTAGQNLDNLPPNSWGYLKYAIGRKFLGYYPSANWSQLAEDEYLDYYKMFKVTNETDLTLRPSIILTAPLPFYWQTILGFGS